MSRRVIGVVAVTVLVLFGGKVVDRIGGDNDDRGTVGVPGTEPRAEPPSAPDGTRLVGMGGVAVAVPEDWVVAGNGCARETGVIWRYPDSPADSPPSTCPPPPGDGGSASLAVGDLTSIEGRRLGGSWFEDMNVNGLALRQESFHHGPQEFCGPGETPTMQQCDLMFSLLTEEVFFRVNAHTEDARALIISVRDSIQLLPEGFTTVPFIRSGVSDQEAEAALLEAGLVAEPPGANFPHYVVGTRPAAGSVVPLGQSVSLLPGDR